jgi:uncharacterized protein
VKLLIDTNVLIAALIANGFCHELLEYCFLNHTLVTSNFILAELEEKLTGKFKYSNERAETAVELLLSKMEVVVTQTLSIPVCRDPDDDNILAAAAAGNCEYIITGDNDLLELKQYGDIKIATPRGFADSEDDS